MFETELPPAREHQEMIRPISERRREKESKKEIKKTLKNIMKKNDPKASLIDK